MFNVHGIGDLLKWNRYYYSSHSIKWWIQSISMLNKNNGFLCKINSEILNVVWFMLESVYGKLFFLYPKKTHFIAISIETAPNQIHEHFVNQIKFRMKTWELNLNTKNKIVFGLFSMIELIYFVWIVNGE